MVNLIIVASSAALYPNWIEPPDSTFNAPPDLTVNALPPNDLEIIRFNIDIPKGNSIYFPQGNIIRFAIDSLENLWISNGKSIKLFSTDDGVKYHGKYLVNSGELFAVSSNLLFVFNKGPYYFPKPMNDIEGVLDVYSGIDVYERQKETNLFKIIKSIHEKDSIVENLYGYRFFIDRDNHLVVGKSVGSKIMAIYFNEKLELLYKKKGIYMNKGEKDIYFDRDNVPFDADVPKNKRHGLLILDSDEKILNKYYFENEFDYIRNIYGEIVYVENANELLQFDSDGKIKSEVE